MFLYNSNISANNLETKNEITNNIVKTSKYSYSLTLTANASKEAIWDLWENVENWKSYDTVIEYSYLEGDVGFITGAIGYVKTKGAPKTQFKLIEVEVGNSFIESLSLPLWSSLELKRRVVSLDVNKVAFTHEVVFKGRFKKLMYALLAKRFKKDLKKVMLSMKEIVEDKDID